MKTYLIKAEEGKLIVREVDKYTKRDYTSEAHFFHTATLKLWAKDSLVDSRSIGDDSGKIKRAIIFDPKREISINTDPGYSATITNWRV